jgi:hypothetical protein
MVAALAGPFFGVFAAAGTSGCGGGGGAEDLFAFFFAGVGTPLPKVASRLTDVWPAVDLELDLGVTAGAGRVDFRFGGIFELRM